MKQYVIIGNGIAAAGCIEGIRSVDPEGEITVVSGENRAAAKHTGKSLSAVSSAEKRAAKSQEEHKLKVRMEYKQLLETKTKAEELQDKFLTDLNASDDDLSIFDTIS